MPHFVVHCSDNVLRLQPEEKINQEIHRVANDSGLFRASDIKVRVMPFSTYLVGNEKRAFIHVFASIMQGRTQGQQSALSTSIVEMLITLFPDVDNIAMNVSEFEKSTYCNKAGLLRSHIK